MKKTILFLALLCGAVAEEKTPTIQPNSTITRDASSLSFSVAAEASAITAKYLVVVQGYNGNPIIRIGEMPYEKVVNTQPNSFIMQPYRYLRPAKPEDIKIELWTEDGKKWVPKWEEAK